MQTYYVNYEFIITSFYLTIDLIPDKIILEIKAKRIIGREDYYQTKRYLTTLNKKLAIVVNFRDKTIKPKRIINSLALE